jgi:hypothetical protein
MSLMDEPRDYITAFEARQWGDKMITIVDKEDKIRAIIP